MSNDTGYIPNFLDRVIHNGKDGMIIAFDDSEAMIRYDDDSEKWIRFERIRLHTKADDWIYLKDGSIMPCVRGLIGGK